MALIVAVLAVMSLQAAQEPAFTDVERTRGQQQFAQLCAVCHGANAAGADQWPALAGNRKLRTRSEQEIQNLIRDGVPGMPGFPLPEAELKSLARFVRSLNIAANDLKPAGDVAARERFFFGQGQCAIRYYTCSLTISLLLYRV